MGSLAQIAVALGYRVTGCDKAVYPPMSLQLEQAGIELIDGFDPKQLALKPDLVIVGNVVSRGNPLMEAVLDQNIPYVSGPQWLAETVLHKRWVLAVSGTHGKTTTSSMLAWILEYAGMQPGFLIGGVPGNFEQSARLGGSDFFVIEADEYDTAFFDKRSKFVHYRPRTLVINNLEYDHADIFPDLAAIQKQFHHLIRMVPAIGKVIYPEDEVAINDVLEQGCWSEELRVGRVSDDVAVRDDALCHSPSLQVDKGHWKYALDHTDGSAFSIFNERSCGDSNKIGSVQWSLIGDHNVKNAMSAIAAAHHVGVSIDASIEALESFSGVKRRMELLDQSNNVFVYDDFAHHPTAISATLEGLKNQLNRQYINKNTESANDPNPKIIAVIEPRSNTMKQGVHRDQLLGSVEQADFVLWKHDEGSEWSLADTVVDRDRPERSKVFVCTGEIITYIKQLLKDIRLNDDAVQVHVVIMSNGGFDSIHARLIETLHS